MSKVREVLKYKHRIEEEQKREIINRTNRISDEVLYKSAVIEKIHNINNMLDNNKIESVIISIDKDDISKFCRCIYEPEFEAYNIKQIDETTFELKYKEL